jgi:hypothetical protein
LRARLIHTEPQSHRAIAFEVGTEPASVKDRRA